ncbi:META domain-containing protein [Chryseobacterium sp. POL2]|uniref:META domain-containing protein n=1 Tax=Chryseobacterium sp. POL2 TaxID=2713414 RepID=UPI0013E11115|nr:META domain-containing protein [Chryseobacterium sp. POL2]QIG89145.1 META domain-containing protein [Chryseobacterium sp. POL2]
MKHLFLSISAALILASCAASSYSVKKGGNQVALTGSSWILAEEVSTEQPTLVVEADKISGNTGCNNYFSTNVAIDPKAGTFAATNVGSTRKACVNMSVETGFLNMLQQANRYVVSGDTLELYKDNLLLLKFNKK